MIDPALYVTVNGPQRRDVSDFADEFLDEISEMSGSCIDIGSGPGDVLNDFIIPKLSPKATVVCSDISKDMMNFGKVKYKDNKRMSFIELDIEMPDLSEDLVEQFDHVTSFYCLHWCQNMRQVFENIFRLLRPGGTTLLTFVADFSPCSSYKDLAIMPRYQPYMKDADRYIPVYQHAERPRENLKALLKDVGFEVFHCSLREKYIIFDTPDVLCEFMLALDPFIVGIPAELRKEYMNDLVKESTRRNIVLTRNNNNANDYSILSIYHTFRVYLKKPPTK